MSKFPDPVDLHVGARLRYRRMLIGMSQEALGDALGLTFQQVQKYEKGQNRIGASRLHRIAVTLRVPVGFFFEGLAEGATDPAQEAAGVLNPMSFVASPEGLQLNLAFQRIDDAATRRKIVDLVETLARAATA
ncbi:MAG: helix-turn-helix domain-containing protein [Rubrimonas sp.]|uniref:helix-turn-helix domain-containing protein n=1 Tax=Rubrimonas sp. TaxID=2036015 RepID=UPI002FDD0E6B